MRLNTLQWIQLFEWKTTASRQAKRLAGCKTLIKHNLSFHRFYLPAVTKFIRIGIADKNDNPPYFDKALYEAEVDENEDIQHTVLTVTAKDHDECKSITIYIRNKLSRGELWQTEKKKTKVELIDASEIQFSDEACCGWISNYSISSVSDCRMSSGNLRFLER